MIKKDHHPDAGDPEAWESADLKVKRPSTAVVSVRMPAELIMAAEGYARPRSMSISDVIRLATERLLTGLSPTPTFAVVATAATGLKLAGPTVLVHGLTHGTPPLWQQVPQSSGTQTATPGLVS